MQAVILAGGKGTRLRPLTYALPKPLLPVMNRPLVAHLVAALPPEVDEILLTVSYMADRLRHWVDEADDPVLAGREIVVVEEKEPLGTAGAIANCADHLDTTFFVMNGDILSDVDHARQLSFHRENGGLATLALYAVDDPERFGVVQQAQNGRIERFVEKPPRAEAPSNRVNAGVYLFEPEVLDLIPRGRAVSVEREVFPKVADSPRGLWGLPFEGLWIDCGTPQSYLDVHRTLLARDDAGYHAGPGSSFADEVPNAEVAVLGANVQVGHRAMLRGAIVYDDVVVGPDVRLVRTIVGRGVTIGPGAELTDVVVGPDETIPAGMRLERVRVGMRAGD